MTAAALRRARAPPPRPACRACFKESSLARCMHARRRRPIPPPSLATPPPRPQWQQLRIRFWLTESGPYHRAVWASLGALAAPVLAAVPALERPVALARRWFNINPNAAATAAARQ